MSHRRLIRARSIFKLEQGQFRRRRICCKGRQFGWKMEQPRKRYLPWERAPVCGILQKSHREEGMLLPMRRKAGLKDEFFFNNAQECSNFKYKSKIKEAKVMTTAGYRPNLKCTWTGALVMYRKLVEERSRDKQRAVLQTGSFVFSERYRHLEVPLHRWSAMNTERKAVPSCKGGCVCQGKNPQ